MRQSFLFSLLLLLLLSSADSERNRLYWRHTGLKTPVLIRYLQGQATVDPLMRVSLTDSDTLTQLSQKHFDPIARQTYIRVPVTLRDDWTPFAIRYQEDSVTFATVTDVTASSDPDSTYQALGFIWSQDEKIGYLRLGCNGSVEHDSGHTCKIGDLVQQMRARKFDALRRVLLTARVRLPNSGSPVELDYRLSLLTGGSNNSRGSQSELSDYSLSSRADNLRGQGMLADCRAVDWMRLWRSVRISNDTCSVLVYKLSKEVRKKFNLKVAYLAEQPICFDNKPSAAESVSVSADASDASQWKLTLRMLVPDDAGSLLAELASRLSERVELVDWMRLWSATRRVSRVLASRVRVGQLRMPAEGYGGSGEVDVHCRHEAACKYLAAKISSNPVNFWRQIRWQPTYLVSMQPRYRTTDTKPVSNSKPLSSGVEQCFHKPDGPRYAVSSTARMSPESPSWSAEFEAWKEVCNRAGNQFCRVEWNSGRRFVVIQQRQSATERFDRPWVDYVKGFGDGSNFWIGLTAIHLLTTINHQPPGSNLRIELKFWNDSTGVVEYSGFRVFGPESNFRMNYGWLVTESSTLQFDALHEGKGVGFSTYDRDNDNDARSCSRHWGNGGWWFGACFKFYPNGLYPPAGQNLDWKYIKWSSNTEIISLKFVKMMIEV